MSIQGWSWQVKVTNLAYVGQRQHSVADVEVANGTRQAEATRPQAQRSHPERHALAVRVLRRWSRACQLASKTPVRYSTPALG